MNNFTLKKSCFSFVAIALTIALVACGKKDTPTPSNSLKADFTYTYTTSDSTKLQFTDKSTGNNITNWKWDFGDGSSFDGQNPSLHNYIGIPSGTPVKVKLVITDANNMKDSAEKSVVIGKKQTNTLQKPTITATTSYSFETSGDFTNPSTTATLTANTPYQATYSWFVDEETSPTTIGSSTFAIKNYKTEAHTIIVEARNNSSGEVVRSDPFPLYINVYKGMSFSGCDVISNIKDDDVCKLEIYPFNNIMQKEISANGSNLSGISSNYDGTKSTWKFSDANCDGFSGVKPSYFILMNGVNYIAKIFSSTQTKAVCSFTDKSIWQNINTASKDDLLKETSSQITFTTNDNKVNCIFYMKLEKKL